MKVAVICKEICWCFALSVAGSDMVNSQNINYETTSIEALERQK